MYWKTRIRTSVFLVFRSFSRAAPHTPRSATADPHYEDGDGADGEHSGGSSRRRQQPLGRSVGSQSPFSSAHPYRSRGGRQTRQSGVLSWRSVCCTTLVVLLMVGVAPVSGDNVHGWCPK